MGFRIKSHRIVDHIGKGCHSQCSVYRPCYSFVSEPNIGDETLLNNDRYCPFFYLHVLNLYDRVILLWICSCPFKGMNLLNRAASRFEPEWVMWWVQNGLLANLFYIIFLPGLPSLLKLLMHCCILHIPLYFSQLRNILVTQFQINLCWLIQLHWGFIVNIFPHEQARELYNCTTQKPSCSIFNLVYLPILMFKIFFLSCRLLWSLSVVNGGCVFVCREMTRLQAIHTHTRYFHYQSWVGRPRSRRLFIQVL